MAVTNPFALMLFTNSGNAVERVRRTVAASPSSPLWWSLALVALNIALALPYNYLVHPGVKVPAVSWEIMVPAILAINFMGILVMSGLATWAVHRQQRRSWGVPLPEEPRVLWFRPGIWVGTVTSYAMAIGVFLSGVFVLLLFPSLHKQIAGILGTAEGAVTLIFFSRAISYFYGIPKRLFIFRYVIIPVLLIAVAGIALAVVFGQYHQYKKLEARHEAIHRSVTNANHSAVTSSPSHSSTPQVAARQSAMIRYAALLRALVQGSVLMQNLTQGKPVGGTAVISFRLAPSGHLLSARVTQGSGDAVVNRAALKAVMGTRFPPFIRNMPMHPMTFSVSVHLSLYAGNTAPDTGLQHVYRQPLPMVHPGGSSFMSRAIRRSDMHCLAGVPLHAHGHPHRQSLPPWLVSYQEWRRCGILHGTIGHYME